MTSIDLIALAILAGSAVVGLMRGLVREVFSIAALVLAAFAARQFAPMLVPYLGSLGEGALRYGAALVLIFVSVMVLAGVLGMMVRSAVNLAGLGAYDRILGMFFGMLRGAVLLVLLTLLAGLTALPRSASWQAGWLPPTLVSVAQRCLPWLPDELAGLIQFPSSASSERGVPDAPRNPSFTLH